MIFIFNTTGKQLFLKSAEKEDRVTLNLVIPELEVNHPLCHVLKTHKSLADKMLESYSEGLKIKNDLIKRSVTLENNICFYEPKTNEFYNVHIDEDFCRDMYKTSPRNMIVIVSGKDSIIAINDKNVVGQTKYTFKQEIAVNQFYLRWNDWVKLKFPVEIMITDGETVTKLVTSSIKETNKEGREFNRNILKRSKVKLDGDEASPVKKNDKKHYNENRKSDRGGYTSQGKSNFSRGDKKGNYSGGKGGYGKQSNRSNGRYGKRHQ